jgi:hypothetical protein
MNLENIFLKMENLSRVKRKKGKMLIFQTGTLEMLTLKILRDIKNYLIDNILEDQFGMENKNQKVF